MTAAHNTEVARRYVLEAAQLGDYDALRSFTHDNLVQREAVGDGLVDATEHRTWPHGKEGLVEHVRGFRTAIPDAQVAIRRIIADDEGVVVVWTASGTHQGTFLGREPSGERISGTTSSHFRIDEGKIIEYTWFGSWQF